MSDLQHEINEVIRRVCLLFTLALLLAAAAAAVYLGEEPRLVLSEWLKLQVQPCPLVTDYFRVASLPAAFLNAAVCGGFCTLLTRLRHVKFRPNVWAGYFLVVAHCLYGLNLVNMLPLMGGFWLHCRLHRLRFRENLDWAMFITSFGPFVSELLFRYPFMVNVPLTLGRFQINLIAIAACAAMCVFFGVSAPALLPGTSKLHRGYNLYNGGLATGLLGLFMFSFLYKTMGIEPPQPLSCENAVYTAHGSSYLLFCTAFYALLFSLCAIIGWVRNGKTFRGYGELLRDSGYKTNFLHRYPLALTWINLGLYGLMMTAYFCLVVLLTEGAGCTGATCGVILAAMTFAASGQHPKNVWPVLAGYALLSLLIHALCLASGRAVPWTLSTQGYMNGVAFATGLCPFTGKYGRKAGMLAGFFSAVMCTTTGFMHGGFVLYNGGLTAGVAALILLPLADTYVHHTERYGRGLLKPRHAPTEDEETARPLEP